MGEAASRQAALKNAPPPGRSAEASGICPLCGLAHDETIAILVQAEASRVPDIDLRSEIEYCERERAVERAGQRPAAPFFAHRLRVLQRELERRRRLQAYGGPGVPARTAISREAIEEIKRRSDIVELIGRDLPLIGPTRPRPRAVCPLHPDKNPSLTIYRDEGRWYCFGCSQGGTAIDWVMVRRGFDFLDAVRVLAREVAVTA